MAPELLTGWGATAPTAAELVRPARELAAGEVVELLAAAGGHGPGRGIIARGLGRSYGDAAQNAGGRVLDATAFDHLAWADRDAGLLTAGGGTSLGTILRAVLPQGWSLPVLPGTRHVTVGGALAADVHGKNHHRDGSFAGQVTAVALASPTGVHRLGPGSDPDLFWATAGGMGLTGVILEATIRLLPVETSWMRVTTERAADLEALMARMRDGDESHRYSVAWVDCLAGGRHLGRSVLSWGEHARLDELPPRARAEPRRFRPAERLGIPRWTGGSLLNGLSARAFNEVWYRRPQAGTALVPLGRFFHPLDGVAGWNQLYGRRGFVQYQLAVPPASAAVVATVIEQLSARRLPSFLAVLKRFGPADPAPLSFPLAGWTLALDLPAGLDGLGAVLDGFDDLVAGAGGRVYLAKDARLRPELLAAMYPGLDQWRSVRRRVDPDGLLQSDLSRRLGLVEGRVAVAGGRP
jgi:decaprenylphospho-beta-D-ribofuranose 2-oxidase